MGFFVALSFALGAARALAAPAALVQGQVLDEATAAPVPGAAIRFTSSSQVVSTRSDSAGAFELAGLAPGLWQVRVEALGYERLALALRLAPGRSEHAWRLRPQPLLMDELVVRPRRAQRTDLVERIEGEALEGAGADLAQVLDGATGVSIRRYGGLGSFSTLSIRGSTSEQVLVFLDGVPLNSALGGGVDVGSLPLGGLESIDIYRGAVPARFGGNSMGGVVHLRTRRLSAAPRAQVRGAYGSFASRHLGLSLGGARRPWRYLALLDYSASANDFRFLDDNGTEYNAADDEWSRRRNSDFAALRTLFKVGRPTGAGRLQAHSTFDLSHRGIPGLANNQSLHTRFDTWRHIGEVEWYGPLWSGRGGYRLGAYHSVQADEYKDLRGEVGIGIQHDRNRTRSLGVRGEVHALPAAAALLSAFVNWRAERFAPRSALEGATRLRASRRRGLTVGGELEWPLAAERLVLQAGGQWEHLANRLFDAQGLWGAVRRARAEDLWGARLGLRLALAAGWTLRGHVGRYQRAPSFFELFGDRGAVIGNGELRSESGRKADLGLVYRAGEERGAGVELAEVALYRHAADDLIRFVHNSQQVSRPHNIGAALLRGLEMRWQARWGALCARGNYVYQRAENRAAFPFEKGNDLPNAPRHRLGLRLALRGSGGALYYEYSRESRHFLDRANLRPVPARALHGLGVRRRCAGGATLSFEVRNLSDDQVADLWGYPLPGRAYFLSLHRDFTLSIP